MSSESSPASNGTAAGTLDPNYRFKAAAFLTSVTGLSACLAFGVTLASAKKRDPRMFEKGVAMMPHGDADESGIALALRALKWGTFYSVTGTSLMAYGIWKLTGCQTMEEFRFKVGSFLPRIPRNEVPRGRTEFSGLNDLLSYLSSDYSKTPKS